MSNFADIFNEVGKLLEETKAVLSEIANEKNAEPEKKGVSWDEFLEWVAEADNVGEFEMETDFGEPTYVKKDDDLHPECENCGECEYCGQCGCDEYLNHEYDDDDYGSCDCEYCIDDDDFNYDDYDEYYDECDDSDCNEQESEPPSERLSLLEYREALFRHIEKKNPDYRTDAYLDAYLELTNTFSNVIWEVLAGPNTATPEEISAAHVVFIKSRYLPASIISRFNYPGCPGLEINLEGVENEIENYLKEKN